MTRAERLDVDRERLEAAIAEAAPRELPALVREHRILLAELESLAGPQKGNVRDQIAERRAAREAAATGSSEAGVR